MFFAVATWLLWRSQRDLGRSFSPELEITEGQALVTDGVYKQIRHPMYTAHLFLDVAQLFLLQNYIAGPAMFLTQIPLYLYRIPREEQMMLDAFGHSYRNYMERTGRLAPKL